MNAVIRRRFYKLSAIIIIGTVLAFVFSRILAPAWDLDGLFRPVAQAAWAGQFSYAQFELFTNPPWGLVLLLPLGWLSASMAHGVLVVITLIAMYGVMRKYRRALISYPLAVISMPLVGVVWVGQLEVFSLVGALIAYHAVAIRKWPLMALGLLLLTIKPQETFVVVLLLVLGTLRRWSFREWIKIGLMFGGVALITSLLFGFDWLTRLLRGPSYVSGWQNFALWQLQEHWPVLIVVALWILIAVATAWSLHLTGVSRLGLAVGAVASNLLSPYLTAAHLLMTVCFGWGYLVDRSTPWGVVAYMASLTPLLRLTSGNQSLNQLDVIFPLIVFGCLLAETFSLRATKRPPAPEITSEKAV